MPRFRATHQPAGQLVDKFSAANHNTMIYLHILGDSTLALWGLDATTRLERQLAQFTEFERLERLGSASAAGPVLVVRAEYLFEPKTLEGLVEAGFNALRCADDGELAAVYAPADKGASAVAALLDQQPGDFEVLEVADLASFDGFLRKVEPPLLAKVDHKSIHRLESVLYGNAYKGITDLVTKWWWPRPARVVVGWCANAGISPNAVTILGGLLMLASCWLFYHGYYAVGLLGGWIMTFLDTVDGKLARVTIQSSKLGHVLDHGMDIVHPPFWYVFWGLSLPYTVPNFEPWLGLSLTAWWGLIVFGYIAGRLLEGAFHALGDCSLFAWRPFDAYNRLITARRNPLLILLTLSVLVQRPDWGFYSIVLWTLLSSALMVVRLAQAAIERVRTGPVSSWLADPEAAARDYPAAFTRFSGTQSAYGDAAKPVPGA